MRQTDYVVLGLLSEAPLTGYQIKRIVDVRFRFFWNESYGQLYPTLKSLKARGLIAEVAMEEPQNRAQKAYQLRPEGLAALQQWLQQPVEKETLRLEILLKMYFSHLIDAQVMIGHVRQFQQTHQQDLQVLGMFAAELNGLLDDGPDHRNLLRVIDFGQKVNEAYLAWSQATIEYLESKVDK